MQARLDWCLGGRRPIEYVETIGLFAAYLILDRVTHAAARLSGEDVTEPLLLAGAITSNRSTWLITTTGGVAALLCGRARLACRWEAMEHGKVLRLMALGPLVLLAWSSSLYHYNFLAGRWHVADRMLVAGLTAASLYRPLWLIPLVIELRVIAAQFTLPFGTAVGQNIDALLITGLVGLAALYTLHLTMGTRRSSPVILLFSTALASHFFVPGAAKVTLGWIAVDHIWNLPLSAYTAGWMASTSGSWARSTAGLAKAFNQPLLLATLVVEIGAALAVVHTRLLRVWIPLAMILHVLIFAVTGFWFIAWIVLEASLLIVLWRPELRPWTAGHVTPAFGLLAATIVVLGGERLYHPPRLSWLDGPVSYGYALEGTGTSGAAYHVPLSVGAPFQQELSFVRLQLASTGDASAAYGAVGTREAYRHLHTIESFDVLARYERTLPHPAAGPGSASERFMVTLLAHINRHGPDPWFVRPPPTHFWTSRPDPVYAYQEPLARLDVIRVTALHRGTDQLFRRELVLRVDAGRDGTAHVSARAMP